MKSRITRALPALAAALAMAGCANIERTNRAAFRRLPIDDTPGTSERLVHVSNYGYYLFNTWPIFTGSTRNGSLGKMRWFSDDVTLDDTQRIMMNEAKAADACATQIHPKLWSTCYFSAIPYIGNTLGILWYKEAQMSAVLVRPETPAPKGN